LISFLNEKETILINKIDLKSVLPLDFPLSINIEVTNACNLRCVMCPREMSSKQVGFIKFDLFKKIIDECSNRRLKKIILHKDGEPLLHPELPEMVRYAKEANAADILSLTTNGILLDERLAVKLVESGLDEVCISIDAADPKTYEKIKGKDAYEIVESNCEKLAKMKNKFPFITVKFIRMKENINEEQGFLKRWETLLSISTSHYWDWGGAVTDSSIDKNKTTNLPCDILWYAMAVNWDGAVSVCCVDWDCKGIIGNVSKNSLCEIWHGEKLHNIRKIHLELKAQTLPVCTNCTYKKFSSREEIGTWLLNNKEKVLSN